MAPSKIRLVALGGAALLALGGGAVWLGSAQKVVPEARASTSRPAASSSGSSSQRGPERPVAVQAVRAKSADLRVTRNGLGTVVSQRTVTMKSRVQGQLERVLFEEGALVERGQVIALVDSRPFQAAALEVQGQLLRNQALLAAARIDLERYRALREERIAKQEDVDSRESLVRQYEGALLAGEGALKQASLQLAFTKITAPISGRIGLRKVDEGNNVSPSDPEGIAVINAVQPISVVFTLPEDDVPLLHRRLTEVKAKGEFLVVEAWDKGSKNLLGQGKLLTLDNQIDPSTGTVKLKAEFSNEDGVLFPNQFVNAKLVLDTLRSVTVIPHAAVQRGRTGPFVYVVTQERTVERRNVVLGPADGEQQSVSSGVVPGDLLVVSGVDRLREGSKVVVSEAGTARHEERSDAKQAPASKMARGD